MLLAGIIALLSFSWRDVAERLHQPAMVEPVDPFQCCELDGFERSPWSTSMDHFGLVQAIDGLSERVVVKVADTTRSGSVGHDARVQQVACLPANIEKAPARSVV